MDDNIVIAFQVRGSTIRALRSYLKWLAIVMVIALVAGFILGSMIEAERQRQQIGEVIIIEEGGLRVVIE